MRAVSLIEAEALASWVLQTGTMVALLLGLVLIIRRPFAKAFGAKAAYALWAIPALRLFIPALTWPAAFTPEWMRPQMPEPITRLSEIRIDAPVMMQPATITPDQIDFPWAVALISLWLAVAMIWLGRQLWQQHHWMKTLDEHTNAVPDDLWADIEQACQSAGLRKTPNVRMSLDGLGPCVTGLLRPIVLLPNNFANDYSAEQRKLALIHELAHIRRGDLIAALAALIFRAINWPNPLVHYAARFFQLDQEAACDATVIGFVGRSDQIAASYAQTLVHAAKSAKAETQTHPSPLGLALADPSPSSQFRAG